MNNARRIAWVLMFALWAVSIAAGVRAGAWMMPVVVAEVLCVGLASSNALRAPLVDGRTLGLLVPVAYATIWLATGSAGVVIGPWPGAVMAAGSFVTFVTLYWIGGKFSIGASTWMGLVAEGPYRVVRHPQTLGRLLVGVGLLMSQAYASALVVAAGCVVIVLVEEGFLLKVEEYRAYAARVRWRMLPGVW